MNIHDEDRSEGTVYEVAIETALFQVWYVKMKKKVGMNKATYLMPCELFVCESAHGIRYVKSNTKSDR